MLLTSDTIQSIKLTDKEAQYDEKAKWLLSRKIFLAHILIHTVEEFHGMKPTDVIPYIEGEPYISTIPVNPGLTNKTLHSTNSLGQKIIGLNTEEASLNEGVIVYDILFYVRMKNGLTQIIVNIEAQQKFPTNYHILNRAIVYSGRMIGSQKERDFTHSDYDAVRQTYSIWICMNMNENSMEHFQLTGKKILGNFEWDNHRNLINIVMIGLSNDLPPQDHAWELHRLLGTILSKQLPYQNKLDILKQEYDIKAENDVKEVIGTMCNLSQGIKEDGIRIGEARGIQIGEARGKAQMILSMKQAGFSLEQIAQIAKCSAEQIEEILIQFSEP